MEQSGREHKTGGSGIINQLSIVLKSGQFHDIENAAVLESMVRLMEMVNAAIEEEGMLKIELAGDFFYVNDTRIRYSVEHMLNFDYLADALQKKGTGSVVFLSTVKITDIKMFLRAFLKVSSEDDPFDALSDQIRDIATITVDRLRNVAGEAELDKRKVVKKSYFNAVSYIGGIMSQVQAGQSVNMKRAKRVVETMVDAILEEEQLLIGMTSLKDYDNYTFHHCVNVSILSIAIGQRIGLDRRNLTNLGISALFHDIGKKDVPSEILNKPTYLTEDDWKVMQKHPTRGALSILMLKGIDHLSIQNALVAFQHHMSIDASGYPKLAKPMKLTLYSKIIAMVDQYDAMTSSRVYRRKAMPPDKALGLMIEGSGTKIDPVLLKIFVNMVGAYPIGSLVLLDTKELGLVYEGNYHQAERPRVLIIADSTGQKTDGSVVDLAEKDEFGGYLRTVVKTLDPKKYGISLAEYLL